jgi:chemotaxis protein MotA
MNIPSLFDPISGGIVVGGTLLASLLQCGLADAAAAVRAVLRLGRRRFDPAKARAELSGYVQDIRQDGVVRGQRTRTGDRDIDDATEALIGARSVSALIENYESHRTRRTEANERARAALVHAADLAPVFGLAGTLLALARLADGSVGDSVLTEAIGSAVLTTLYGLLLAHLILAPLARAIERGTRAEEKNRQEVIDWLATQLGSAIPRAHLGHPRAIA